MILQTLFQKWKNIDLLDKGLSIFFVLGVMIGVISLFSGILGGSQVQIEYLEGETVKTEERIVTIWVDVEGAVEKAGMYELKENARLKDALVQAGGFSEKADRDYCEKNLNLAQLLKDGQKVYIPYKQDTPSDLGYIEAKNESETVNVNTDSMAKLDTLIGVGPSRAEILVKNRPYSSAEELVSKGGLTKQLYEKNKEVIVFY